MKRERERGRERERRREAGRKKQEGSATASYKWLLPYWNNLTHHLQVECVVKTELQYNYVDQQLKNKKLKSPLKLSLTGT